MAGIETIPVRSTNLPAWQAGMPYLAYTYAMTAACLGIGVIGLCTNPMATLVAGALICGWSEVDGLCGTSHVCSMAAIRTLKGRRGWLAAVSAYTLGGLFSAAVMGAVLGTLSFAVSDYSGFLGYATLVLAIVLIARELDLLAFDLPQVHRQTQKMWAPRFGFTTAAGMWGSHIGLGVATVIQHGGFFLIVASIVLLGPFRGMVVMCVYWSGRTLPLWLGRALTSTTSSDCIGPQLHSAEPAYKHAAIAGILMVAASLAQTTLT